MRQELKSVETTNNVSTHSASTAFSSYAPKSFDEWMKISTMIANSNLCPNDFRGKPENVFVACQMGADVGLKPMQSIQNIAVINGRPCLWGDAALAVVKGHPDFVDIEEVVSEDSAVCIIKRRNSKNVSREFTKTDAERAKLWGKAGPWSQYPTRMLQMRARGFALRDAFPDALRGINIAEEVRDYPAEEKDVTPPTVKEEINELAQKAFEVLLIKIDECQSMQELEILRENELKKYKGLDEYKNELREAYKLKVKAFKDEAELTQAMEANHVDEPIQAE